MNPDLRSEHILRLISGARRRLVPPLQRTSDDGRRRLRDRRERVGVVAQEVADGARRPAAEHGDGAGRELAGADR
jgi:hypothetical protein